MYIWLSLELPLFTPPLRPLLRPNKVKQIAFAVGNQGRISPYKFLVPCLSVRVKFTNQ